MTFESAHPGEDHKSHRSNWLRAAVLGVNDGVVSTASLMLGVLASSASKSVILTAGVAGLVAGALSMAVGEYVSVSSQKDSELSDLAMERRSLEDNPDAEMDELVSIYQNRGLDKKLAQQVAQQLHDHNALDAHARDELGIDHEALANPLQASIASAGAFSIGAIVPVLAAVFTHGTASTYAIVISSLFVLGISGAVGAFIGGGHKLRAAARVFFGGAAAMAITALIGHLVGTNI